MKIQRLAQITLGALLTLAATGVQACGEVMYRMGGALHYRAFITKHPAQIILYAGGAAKAAETADSQAFHHNLEKAGHKVTVVDTPEGFARALAEHPYDVVIAFAADLPSISTQIEHAAREPSLIPVFNKGSDERAERQQYPLALSEDANLNDFLKTIEKSMKARGT